MLIQAFTGLPSDIRLREMGPEDLPFLAALYASTRLEELESVDWQPEQKQAFLKQQFEAQHSHYQQHFTDAEYLVIEQEDGAATRRPIGRLYLDERADEIRLIDIALLPDHRNNGLGSRFLQRLLNLAEQRGLAVRLHVEQFNPAAEWYRRFGFKLLDDLGVYLFMEWKATN